MLYFFQYIPKPREPPPPLPQDSLYDLDVNAKSNTSSPSKSVVSRSAPSPPSMPRPVIAAPAPPQTSIGTPPPLPKRQSKNINELPKVPERSGPPPLPARPNTQM